MTVTPQTAPPTALPVEKKLLERAYHLAAENPQGEIGGFLRELIPFIARHSNDSVSLKRGGDPRGEGTDALLEHVPFLRRLELFKPVNYENLATLAQVIVIRHFAAGEKIIQIGDPGDSLFLIFEGRVEVVIETKEKERKTISTMGVLDIFGEMALLTGQPRSADVVALEATTVFVISKENFNSICQKSPKVSTVLTEMVAARLGSDSGNMLARQVGKYQIEKTVGKGGMGIVYLAHDTKLGRTVAMKMLPHELVFNEPFVNQFLEEGKLVARLDHENIVRLYDVVHAYATYFMVMEYIDSDSLEKVLREKKTLSVKMVMDIIDQIGAALTHARGLGIVHRDIKPDNIKFTSDGKVKLMDFGIAVTKKESDSTLETSYEGKTSGTIRYMSPEQGQGKDVDFRSDIYAFGICVYQMLVGKTPFIGNNLISIVLQQISKPVEPPSKFNQEVPPWLDDFVVHALDKDVEKRLNSFAGVRQIVRQIKMGVLPIDCRVPFEAGEFQVTSNDSFIRMPARSIAGKIIPVQKFFDRSHLLALALVIFLTAVATFYAVKIFAPVS